jgi:hypothetical protein
VIWCNPEEVRPADTQVGSSGKDSASGLAGPARGARGSVMAAARYIVNRRVVLAAGFVASLPIIVSMVHAVLVGWAPVGDDAVIAVRSLDVLSSHSPLVGQYSTASAVIGAPTYSPGPLLYWLLALPSRVAGPTSLPVTVGVVNVACVMGAVGVAHRRGGRPLMFAVAIAVPLMLASLPADVYSDVWNPSAPLLPFMLLIFLAWSVACGEVRFLPLAVLLASFVAQAHVTYIAPALAALAVGVGCLALPRRRAGERPDAVQAGAAGRRRVMRASLGAALVVAVICWSAPLIDQVVHRPGNLDQLLRAALGDHPKLGLDAGWRALCHCLGIPPWWLSSPRGALARIADLTNSPGALSVGSALLILGGLAAVTRAGWRRRRRDILAAAGLGLALCPARVFSTASVPTSAFATVDYALWWASPAGMWVWLVLGWSGATLLGAGRRLPSVRLPAVAGLGAAAAVASLVAVTVERRPEFSGDIRRISADLKNKLPPDRPVRVDASLAAEGFMAADFQLGIVYTLRRDGRPVSAPRAAKLLGSRYGLGSGSYVLRVDVDRPPPPRTRTISRLVVSTGRSDNPFSKAPPRRLVTVTLASARAGR